MQHRCVTQAARTAAMACCAPLETALSRGAAAPPRKSLIRDKSLVCGCFVAWPVPMQHRCVTVSGVNVRSRTVGDGSRRHDVQYRRGGRGYKVEHAGTFTSLKEALIRRDLVAGWLAAGLNPRAELERILNPPSRKRFAQMAADWLASRVDIDESTLVNYTGQQVRIDNKFGVRDPATITPADVNGWIAEMVADGLKAGTVGGYVRQVRMILDELDDNPARHRSVRLPKHVQRVPEPPDAEQFLAMLPNLAGNYRLACVLLEQTGMRVSEGIAMSGRDIDRDGLRVRVRPEEAKTGRPRWIPVEPWILDVLEPLRGVERTALGNAMRRTGTGIHPHLLRHRRATLWHQQGLVAVELASRLGHARPSMSLDLYSHVRPLQEASPERVLYHLTRP